MSIEACADLVERGDPDRFLSAMTASTKDRGALFVLYAFNLEVARAPWITAEAMIAEMRLQWWHDVIDEIFDGKDVRRHEVVTPLAALIMDRKLDRATFDALIEARRWDIYKQPHENHQAMEAYIANTSGGLMWLAAQSLGAEAKYRNAIVEYGYGVGVASLLKAIPILENAQKYPLIDGTPDGVAKLADVALQRILTSSTWLNDLPKPIRAALRSGWMAVHTLETAKQTPQLVASGDLEPAEFNKKIRLFWKTLRNTF